MSTPAQQPAWPPSPWDMKLADLAGDEVCAKLVLDAYTNAVRSPNRQDAFKIAVGIWRERNPNASPEMAGAAVATILAKTL